MGATYQRRGKSYRIAVHANGERRYVTVKSEADAKALVREVKRLELNGVNVIEAMKSARAATPPAAPSEYPTLKTAVLDYIASQERAGELRPTTARGYRSRCKK